MIDLGSLAAPAWLVVVAGVLAILGSIVMLARGHAYIFAPIAFSIGWITLGYFFYAVGSFDQEDLSAIVRSGFIVLCATIVTGGAIFLRGHKRK